MKLRSVFTLKESLMIADIVFPLIIYLLFIVSYGDIVISVSVLVIKNLYGVYASFTALMIEL